MWADNHLAGKTEDGKEVIRDVAVLVGTHGIPLDIVLAYLYERGQVVDWEDFIRSYMAEGASLRTIRAKIHEAIGVIYTPSQQEEFKEKLELLLLLICN